MALLIDILNFCMFYGHCKKEIAFHTSVGQDEGEKEEERKRENMSIGIPNRQTKYPTSCDQILVNPPSCSQIPFPVKIFAFSHIPPHILAKSRIPKILFQTLMQGRGARHLKAHKALILYSIVLCSDFCALAT